MASFDFTLVDVFGTSPISGNPLAVIHNADRLTAEEMQHVARYFNLSETAFLLQPCSAEAHYAVRFFALDRELPWAGHPTLGACHAWIEAGQHRAANGTVMQQTGDRLTRINRTKNDLSFAAPILDRFERPAPAELSEALSLIGSDGSGLVDAKWIDNGPGWLGLLFDAPHEVLALKPFGLWPAAHHIGVLALPSEKSDVVVARAFHTDQFCRIVEDPVTGSFAAAAGRWLTGEGRLPSSYSVSQGQCVDRCGEIRVTKRDDDLWISGATRTVVRGTASL